jgi:hypothetical protein
MMEALFGALIGAVLGFFGSFSIWHFEHLRQRRIAKMQIAINVRHWMTRTLYLLQDAETGEDGVGGFFSWQLPDFRFEQSLEQVASVEDQMAVKIFKLIRKKDDANAEVESILEHADEHAALKTLRGRTAQTWLRALEIYDAVSEQVGWSDPAFSNAHKEMMRAEAARLE